MLNFIPKLLLLALPAWQLVQLGLAAPTSKRAYDTGVDVYFAKQVPISEAGTFANIDSRGVVVASPDDDPNYRYVWTRDSSLVFQAIVDRFVTGNAKYAGYQTSIEAWIQSAATLQGVSNPSGAAYGDGLGEPKFNLDLTAFTGAWGRPQRDGPALRASAMITYANAKSGDVSYIWSVIKYDLDYTASTWNLQTFDLWEEVRASSSFFTTMSQYRALVEGAKFATKRGDTTRASRYSVQAKNALCQLQKHWNGNAIIANLDAGGRSGLDANTPLASIYGFDPSAGCDDISFQPCSARALSGLKALVDSFRGSSVTPINANYQINQGVAIGRYKEDSYYGGNPWYLATFAVAEQLYSAANVWTAQKSITVNSVSLAFWKDLYPAVTAGTFNATDNSYAGLLSAVQAYADSFTAVNAKYTPADGGLSEQYSAETGVPTSAIKLTWSYVSSLTAFDRRSGINPGSWGATSISLPVGGTCSTNEILSAPVTFTISNVPASPQKVVIIGSIDALGSWSMTAAPSISSQGNNVYSGTINIPQGTSFQYKAAYVSSTGAFVYEQIGSDALANRAASVGSSAITLATAFSAGATQPSNTIAVTFNVSGLPSGRSGELVAYGSLPILGSWTDVSKAPRFTVSGTTAKATIYFPINSSGEYKLRFVSGSANDGYEGGSNRKINLGSSTAAQTWNVVWQN